MTINPGRPCMCLSSKATRKPSSLGAGFMTSLRQTNSARHFSHSLPGPFLAADCFPSFQISSTDDEQAPTRTGNGTELLFSIFAFKFFSLVQRRIQPLKALDLFERRIPLSIPSAPRVQTIVHQFKAVSDATKENPFSPVRGEGAHWGTSKPHGYQREIP